MIIQMMVCDGLRMWWKARVVCLAVNTAIVIVSNITVIVGVWLILPSTDMPIIGMLDITGRAFELETI